MLRIYHTNIYKINDYSKHLKNLTEGDKISRFGYNANNHTIDSLILSICYHPDDHQLWYAEIKDERVGWGHMARHHDNSWELAVSVDHDHQRQGVANTLIAEMLSWAKFHKIDEVYMYCIEDNKVIQHLADKHNLKSKSKSYGERTSVITVPEPTFLETNAQLWKEHNEIMAEFAILRKRLNSLWTNALTPKSLT